MGSLDVTGLLLLFNSQLIFFPPQEHYLLEQLCGFDGLTNNHVFLFCLLNHHLF